MNEPVVSVLLPVYNGAAYLKEAIESILSQTFTDFELIIIDDGSSDESSRIIAEFNDPRIRAYYQENQGLATTLNRAITLAAGKYLARQDQDDISLPTRFEKQVEFLEAHSDYGIVGTWADIWEESTPSGRFITHAPGNVHIKFNLLFDNSFVHSSVLFRKSLIDDVGFYYQDGASLPEDYELWSRVLRSGTIRMANLPEVLTIYREVKGSMCRSNSFAEAVISISTTNLAWVTGRDISDDAVRDLAILASDCKKEHSPVASLKQIVAVMHVVITWLSKESSCMDDALKKAVNLCYLRVKINYINNRQHQCVGRACHYLFHFFGVGKLLR